MKLVGANAASKITGLEQLPGTSNYFIGNDPEKWRTSVPNYAKVQYRNVYPGVDLVYYGNQRQMECDFVVAPGADPHAIKLDFAGTVGEAGKSVRQKSLPRIDSNGDLVMRLNGREVSFHKPTAYQMRSNSTPKTMVEAGYVLRANGQVGIRLSSYDHARTLTIDPILLVYSSYIGGSFPDGGYGVAMGDSGNAYVAGYTASYDFPTVHQITGACRGSCGTGFTGDAFVAKINAAGSALVYFSYIGGSLQDFGTGIAVDSSGNAYLTGSTASSNFPIVNQIPGACQGSCGIGSGASDTFLTKINAAGSALLYSSYVGGSNNDVGNAIAVDSSGNTYVAGYTESSDFPIANQIPGACQGSCGTVLNGDAFVTKIGAAGNALVYSSYIGGSLQDIAPSIAVDGSGSAYLTGSTGSSDFPIVNQVPGACQGSCGTGLNKDVFVTRINAAGSALVYSSYIGGTSDDLGNAIAVDRFGNAYVTGTTSSSDYPIVNPIPGACEAGCGTGFSFDAFVTTINPIGSALGYSSYIGGNDGDFGYAIAVDELGNTYVAGLTYSTNFPTVSQIPGASLGTCGFGRTGDVFVTRILYVGPSAITTYRPTLPQSEGRAHRLSSGPSLPR